jgi:hypothetical protein
MNLHIKKLRMKYFKPLCQHYITNNWSIQNQNILPMLYRFYKQTKKLYCNQTMPFKFVIIKEVHSI